MPTLPADSWIQMVRNGVTYTISRTEERTTTTDTGNGTFDTDICRLEMSDGSNQRTTWRKIDEVDLLLVALECDGWTETATGTNPPP